MKTQERRNEGKEWLTAHERTRKKRNGYHGARNLQLPSLVNQNFLHVQETSLAHQTTSRSLAQAPAPREFHTVLLLLPEAILACSYAGPCPQHWGWRAQPRLSLP